MSEEKIDVGEKLVKLPLSRIRQLVNLDPDVSNIAQEALFLITKATELFLESVTREAYEITASELKKTVTKKHVDAAIDSIDALAFLDGVFDD